ncbi:MAG: MerR family transcriptional regulator [Oscillospiraceae bacterium]|nr:MerR family transcriptional regulator [Oscillospiraceae bacterium]
MKEYYSIGETAKLLGVSTQTLRYYDREGILRPETINEETGYRYYSYMQFHKIDRIKYLQSLGLSLEEIGAIIQDGTIRLLMPALSARKEALLEHINQTVEQIKDIDWYINYFTYTGLSDDSSAFYRIHLPERYVLEVPCDPEEPLGDMEIRLAEKKGRLPYSELPYRRQYGYRIRMEDLLRKKFRPSSYFIFTKSRPDHVCRDIQVIPEGDFVCFRTPILKECWDADGLRAYFTGLPHRDTILALEFEDNLVDWSDAVYEVQIMI